MALIRSKDTEPEIRVRRMLHGLGFRFRLHRKDLPGVPDLVMVSRRKAIFIHGCFWHAHENCMIANRPKSRRSYWDTKFKRTKERDKLNEKALKKAGWDVVIIWECQTKDISKLEMKIIERLRQRPKLNRTKRG